MPRRKKSGGNPPTAPRAAGGGQQSNSTPQAGHQNQRSDRSSKWCDVHEWNSSHDTKDCRAKGQSASANRNPNQNQGQGSTNNKWCTHCGTATHNTDVCKRRVKQSNNTNPPRLPPPINTTGAYTNTTWIPSQPSAMEWSSTVPQPQHAASGKAMYCEHCNSRSHMLSACVNTNTFTAFQRSHIRCRGCGVKNHTADNCRNPKALRCTRCLKKGHHPDSCHLGLPVRQSVPESALKTPGIRRFVWRVDPEYKMHPSQWMRLKWEEYQQDKSRRGETISDAFRQETEREIAVAEAKVFTRSPITPRSARSVWFNPPTRRPSGQVIPNYKMGSDKRAIKPRALEFIDPAKLRGAGLNTPEISAIEAVHLAHEAAAITEHEKAIIHKINHSLKYPQAHVNSWLRGKQRDILEKELLSPEKFDGIKGLMHRGWNFYRDPRAMRALFEREAPFCMGCTGRGDILDCRFNKIAPTTSEVELLKLEDLSDWGLFLVFACRCAAEQGYWYRKHTPLELEGFVDEDEKYAQALVRYLG